MNGNEKVGLHDGQGHVVCNKKNGIKPKEI